MIRLRPALWPTLISLPILVLSLGLGIWQIERREWKRDILDRLVTNQAAAPLSLDELLRSDPLHHEYGRLELTWQVSHQLHQCRHPAGGGPTTITRFRFMCALWASRVPRA